MHPICRGRILIALAGAALALGARPAESQERPVSSEPTRESVVRLDARGGIAVPTADLRDHSDEGPVVAAGISYRIGERLSVRGDWSGAFMRPADSRMLRQRGADVPRYGSETDLHHLTGGLQVELSDRGANIAVRAHGGVGVTFLSTEETRLAVGGDFTQFTVNGGLELGVPLGRRVSFIGRGDLYVLPFRANGAPHLKKEVMLPFTAGLAVGL